jgi:hypothetical protein
MRDLACADLGVKTVALSAPQMAILYEDSIG